MKRKTHPHPAKFSDQVLAYEVTDEWHPHKWSSLTSTPYTPEDET